MYKIVRITDLKDNDKTDLENVDIIGRVIDDTQSTISVGCKNFLYCAIPGITKSIITPHVNNIISNKSTITIITENLKYYLNKIEER